MSPGAQPALPQPTLPTLTPASPLAEPNTHLMLVTLGLGAAVFLIVTGLIGYFAWKYRHINAPGEPPQIFGNARDELVWMGLALAVLALLFVLSWRSLMTVDPEAGTDGPPDLIVTGHQWYWEARYPNSGAAARAVGAANEIHIPTGRRLLVELRSADVIHDFWVPQLTRKMDAIPGQGNRLWLQASDPGTFGGACAEFCGAQHAWMRFNVVAQTPTDFQAWLSAQSQAASTPQTADAARGAALFVSQGCGNCHALRGAVEGGADGNVGPDLTHFASRGIIAGAVLTNTPGNLRRWLADPQAVKPGTRMTNYHLSPAALDDLTAYLETLK